jgi:hypothetical protein
LVFAADSILSPRPGSGQLGPRPGNAGDSGAEGPANETKLDGNEQHWREAVQLVLEANREFAERSLVGQNVSKEPFALPVA